MTSRRCFLLACLFGCFFTMTLALAQSEQSSAPSLLPEENNSPVPEKEQEQEPQAASTQQILPDQQSADTTKPQPVSAHAGKTQEQLLAEMRDIYSPIKPSWWPLAPGWWVLGIGVLVVVGLLLRACYRYLANRRKHDWKKSARAEHHRLCEAAANKSLSSTAIIADASVLMRRVSLSQFPREQVASLTDDQWLDVLDGLGNTTEYRQGVGELLTRHPYMRPHDIAESEINDLLNLIGRTINNAPSSLLHGAAYKAGTQTPSLNREAGIV